MTLPSRIRVSLRRRLSIAEGFVAVVVILALLGAGFAIEQWRGRTRREFPSPLATERLEVEVRGQLEVLLAAIENYKEALGAYPPDHVVSRSPLVVDPVTNQLMYELFGTLYNPKDASFLPRQFPVIAGPLVKRMFNVDRFKNSAELPESVRQFLDKSKVASQVLINKRPDVVGLLGYWPNWEGVDADAFQFSDLPSWRYNSSRPTHNPGKFDLWIELKTARANVTIGNW